MHRKFTVDVHVLEDGPHTVEALNGCSQVFLRRIFSKNKKLANTWVHTFTHSVRLLKIYFLTCFLSCFF